MITVLTTWLPELCYVRYVVGCQLDDLTTMQASVNLIVPHEQALWTIDSALQQTLSALQVKVGL